MTSLVGLLRDLDNFKINTPNHIKTDFNEAGRHVLDSYLKHPLVNKAISRKESKFTFTELMEDLTKKYKGMKPWLPRKVDKEYDTKLRSLNLDEIFGKEITKKLETQIGKTGRFFDSEKHPYRNKVGTWIRNKVYNKSAGSLSLGLSTVCYGMVLATGPAPIMLLWLAGYLGGSLGGGPILIKSLSKKYIKGLNKDAQYLDKKIEEIYIQK